MQTIPAYSCVQPTNPADLLGFLDMHVPYRRPSWNFWIGTTPFYTISRKWVEQILRF